MPHIDFSGNSPVPSPVIEPGQDQEQSIEVTQTCLDLGDWIFRNKDSIPTYPLGADGQYLWGGQCTQFFQLVDDGKQVLIDSNLPGCDPKNVLATCVVPPTQ